MDTTGSCSFFFWSMNSMVYVCAPVLSLICSKMKDFLCHRSEPNIDMIFENVYKLKDINEIHMNQGPLQ